MYDVGMRALLPTILALSLGLCARGATSTKPASQNPLLVKYCYDCHADDSPEGKFAMDSYRTIDEMSRAQPQWSKAIKYIRAHTMPPPKEDQPTEDERDAIVHSIQTAIYHIDPTHPDPGHVVIRRLNATEYRNTIRDLLNVPFDPTADFPPDDTGYGFDNIGDVLSLPPMLLEKYFSAANRIVNVTFGDELPESPHSRQATTQSAKPQMSPAIRALLVKYVASGASTASGNHSTTPAAARAILNDFTTRAWRRPIHDDELDRLMNLYTLARSSGESFESSVKYAMKAVLVSSSFLFRGEVDAFSPSPSKRERGSEGRTPMSAGMVSNSPSYAANSIEPISEYALASRLSYFLWSSTPDDELLFLAAQHELRSHLRQQVKRMMSSPKFDAFAENFAGQWLQFRNMDSVHPDRSKFLTYNDTLRDEMEIETRLFVTSIMREDRSLFDLLTADYTFVNEHLAKHYGLANVTGKEFRRVSLAGTNRRGILTQGSVLTLTSNPTRTSPVKRGKWVMENILATAPPPPPANVPPLIQHGQPTTGTLRHHLEQHRANPSCAACHAAMDPIGLALENFDAVGAWRDTEHGLPIDASTNFPAGPKFVGPVELANLLATTRQNDFLRSAVEHALTYALGRGTEPFDQPAIDQIIANLRKDNARFSTLIYSITDSLPFQMRRVQPPNPMVTAQASSAISLPPPPEEGRGEGARDSQMVPVGHAIRPRFPNHVSSTE
jgi:hypothetical protein